MLTRASEGQSHLAMQGVGRSDGDGLDIGIGSQFPIVAVYLGNLKSVGELPGIARSRRRDANDRHIALDHRDRSRVALRLKLRANDANPYRATFHLIHLQPIEPMRTPAYPTTKRRINRPCRSVSLR